jgi:hypothetical protein
MLQFLGIGAQKSGTTWLYENLAKHPQVYFPGGKEVHFFDMFFTRGLDWYLSQFPDNTDKINGEITPAYAILEEAKIRLIHDINPELRLFYILRDPRERAWSAAKMEMGRAGKTYGQTSDEWFIDQFYSDASLKRGDYRTCLMNWQSVFPKGQLLLLKFTDIRNNPHALMQKLAKHIGIDAGFYAADRAEIITGKVFANPEEIIRPSLKRALHKLYAPQIEEINLFLGSAWFDEEDPAWASSL